MFSLNDLDTAINKLNLGKGYDRGHSLLFKHAKSSFINLICKLTDKNFSYTYIPPTLLKGRIRPPVKSPSGHKTVSQIYTPVMHSSKFLSI